MAPILRDFDFEALEAAAEAAIEWERVKAETKAEAREWERIKAEAAAGRVRYRGVRKVPSGKFKAEIQVSRTQKWLGTYATALLAACAYDIEARRLHGEKARPNFAYPPPPDLVSAIAATPRRRGHSKPAPPALPTPAPAPAPIVDYFSLQLTAASVPLAQPAPAPVPNLGHFSFEAMSSDSFSSLALMRSVSPAISLKTCFSTTVNPGLTDSASSSISCPRQMLNKPEVIAVPNTTTATPRTTQDCKDTDDNFSGQPVPLFFTMPPSAPMPPFDFDNDGAL